MYVCDYIYDRVNHEIAIRQIENTPTNRLIVLVRMRNDWMKKSDTNPALRRHIKVADVEVSRLRRLIYS